MCASRDCMPPSLPKFYPDPRGAQAARAQRCRARAAETTALARLADDPRLRDGYLDLAQHWTILAQEIEAAD